MKDAILWGALGLILGLSLQTCGLSDPDAMRGMLSLRRRGLFRTLVFALGIGALLTAFLGWLAVIDVDTLVILPLQGGVIAGGLLFGAAAGLTGRTPGTAASGIGGNRLLESLCTAAGCVAGAVCFTLLSPYLAGVRELFPPSGNTLFRVTLDRPYLFSGAFLGQGCLGVLLMVLSACIRPEKRLEAAADKGDAAALGASGAAVIPAVSESCDEAAPDAPGESVERDDFDDSGERDESREWDAEDAPDAPPAAEQVDEADREDAHGAALASGVIVEASKEDTPDASGVIDEADKEDAPPASGEPDEASKNGAALASGVLDEASKEDAPDTSDESDASSAADSAADEAFVAALPGEEPLVVDTHDAPIEEIPASPDPTPDDPPAPETEPDSDAPETEPDRAREVLEQLPPAQEIALPVPARIVPKKKKS